MPSRKLFILIIFTFISLSASLGRSYIAGDLSYKYLSDRRYEFTLVVYSECGGSVDPTFISSMNISYYCPSNNLPLSKKLNLRLTKAAPSNGEEIVLYCPDEKSICNGGVKRGVKRFYYKGIVSLTSFKYATDWTFFWEISSRSDQINTANITNSSAYVLKLVMNNKDVTQNSSPTFSSIPTIGTCINQSSTFDVSGIDGEGDVLNYTFSQPLTSFSTNQKLLYNSGFSESSFVSNSSLTLNNSTGILTVTPTNADQVGISDVLITETRNGKVLTSITRGIMISAYNCSNPEPIISGFNDSLFVNTQYIDLYFCVGDTLNESNSSIYSKDNVSPTQLITMSSAIAKYDSWIKPTNTTTVTGIYFDHEITIDDIGIHEITIRSRDNGCPQNAIAEKTFRIHVAEQLKVDIGPSKVIYCDRDNIFNAVISGGFSSPYTYKWSTYTLEPEFIVSQNTLSTSSSYTTRIPNYYYVFVTDSRGCTAMDTSYMKNGINVSFGISEYCNDDSTKFTDLTTSTYTITKWLWEFGDGATSSTPNNTHKYADIKSYSPKLTVTNNVGCSQSNASSIVICKPQNISIITDATSLTNGKECTRKSLSFLDVTTYDATCNPNIGTWELRKKNDPTIIVSTTKGSTSPQDIFGTINKFVYTFDESGIYELTLNVVSRASCVSSKVYEFEVQEAPIAIIKQNSFLINCSNPDTLLAGYPSLKVGTMTYKWTGPTGTTSQIADTAYYLANKVGTYTFTVQSSNGCLDSKKIDIVFPHKALISYDPVCLKGDSLKLKGIVTNNSGIPIPSTSNFPFTFLWKINNTDYTTQNLSLLFSDAKIYPTTLTITDTTNGCKASISRNVLNTFIPERLIITPPDTVPLCARNTINATIDYTFGTIDTKIDTIIWNYGIGANRYFYQPPSISIPGLPTRSGTIAQGRSILYNYADLNGQTNTYYPSVKVFYNKQEGSEANKFCSIQLKDTLKVLPELLVSVIGSRICALDTGLFNFIRTSANKSIPVNTYKWNLYQNSVLIDSDTNLIGELYFPKTGTYQVSIDVVDSLGCKYTSPLKTFTATKMYPGDFITQLSCSKSETLFERNFEDSTFVSPAYTYFWNGQIIKEGFWPMVPFTYTFPVGGTQQITLMLEDENVNKCRSWHTENVELYDQPIINFTFDTVCAESKTSFVNLTTSNGTSGSITSYTWDFGDGKASSEKDPSHIFAKGGNYSVKLIATTVNGCIDTTTKTVFVKEKPEADFIIDAEYIVAFRDLPFINKTAESTAIKSYVWDFGDGKTSSEKDPYHQYSDVSIYTVSLTVVNDLNCRDTVYKRTDLNDYLELPDAFSPNGDNVNDVLTLQHKSITQLDEFKIFNRWGELVFDAEGDFNKGWDGFAHGKKQELGSYVAIVRGRSAYNKDYTFKKTITVLP